MSRPLVKKYKPLVKKYKPLVKKYKPLVKTSRPLVAITEALNDLFYGILHNQSCLNFAESWRISTTSNSAITVLIFRCWASYANVRVGQWLTARKSIRYENIAPLSLSSLRLSPSAPDFQALPRAFSCRFPYLCQTKLMNNERNETLQTIAPPADDAIGSDLFRLSAIIVKMSLFISKHP